MNPNRAKGVIALGKTRCALCNKQGTPKNRLVVHHCDSNPKHNNRENLLVVHDKLCHDFADFISEFYLYHGQKATPKMIRTSWTTFNWKEA